MKRACVCFAVACAVAMAGCGAAQPQDVRTALDAVAAARDAARAELPDHPVVSGAVQILNVALEGYNDIAMVETAEGENRWPFYLKWLQLAAKAVSAVITILDGAGVDIPDVILDANATLQRWLMM